MNESDKVRLLCNFNEWYQREVLSKNDESKILLKVVDPMDSIVSGLTKLNVKVKTYKRPKMRKIDPMQRLAESLQDMKIKKKNKKF